MLKTITYKGSTYPYFQSSGFALRFVKPFADEFLKDKKVGFDIGCMKPEWSYPGSIPVDLSINDPYDAYNLPPVDVDYIISSHCLEHLPDWVGALNIWRDKLPSGGILFLYLPHAAQTYWNPWNNRKHYHMFTPELLNEYFKGTSEFWSNVFISSGYDLNHSFCCVGEKR
jgi:SAM-dependent methyltransferase